ncbi:MAG TPA: hypothetical protein VK178_05320 [Opitutaceae bacterium]|nr:hypothetical protein [Opitutaceae bacterium]
MSPPPAPEPIDWSLCTFEGAEREQLRRWSRLPLRRKLEALDEMSEFALRTLEARRKAGKPYIDPDTGEPVAGTCQPASTVEEPPTPPATTR